MYLSSMSGPAPLTAILICGANGVGKTTFARQLLPMTQPGIDFLNVDEIQRSKSPPLSQVAAARMLLMRLVEVERNRQSFAVETTLPRVRTRRGSSAGGRPGTMLHCTSSRCRLPTSPSSVSLAESQQVGTTSPSETCAVGSCVVAFSFMRYTSPSCPNTFIG